MRRKAGSAPIAGIEPGPRETKERIPMDHTCTRKLFCEPTADELGDTPSQYKPIVCGNKSCPSNDDSYPDGCSTIEEWRCVADCTRYKPAGAGAAIQ